MTFLLILLPGQAWALNSKEVLALYSSSVFKVYTEDRKTGSRFDHGSGFVVAPGTIVTNFHILSTYFSSPGVYQITVANQDQRWLAQLKDFDIVNDLAILQVANLIKVPVIPLRQSPVFAGEKVYSMGQSQTHDIQIVEGNISAETLSLHRKTYALRAILNQEMTGGPTVDLQGNLLGVQVTVKTATDSAPHLIPQNYLPSLMTTLQSERSLASDRSMTAILLQLHKNALEIKDKLENQRSTFKMGSYQILDFTRLLQCAFQRSEDSTLKLERVMTCKNTMPTFISKDLPVIGNLNIHISENPRRKAIRSGVITGNYWSHGGRSIAQDLLSIIRKQSHSRCITEKFMNRHQLFVIGQVCSTADGGFGAQSAVVDLAIAPLNERPIYLHVEMSGYARTDLAELIGIIADGVSWQN